MVDVSWANDFRLACAIEGIAAFAPESAGLIAGVGGHAAESQTRQWISQREQQLALLVVLANQAIEECRRNTPSIARNMVLIRLELPANKDVRELLDTTPPLWRIFFSQKYPTQSKFLGDLKLVVEAFGHLAA